MKTVMAQTTANFYNCSAPISDPHFQLDLLVLEPLRTVLSKSDYSGTPLRGSPLLLMYVLMQNPVTML